MIESDFECRFHDLDYLEVGILFHIFEFIMYFGASSQNFVENNNFYIILSYLKQILDNHLFNITYLHTTCTIF